MKKSKFIPVVSTSIQAPYAPESMEFLNELERRLCCESPDGKNRFKLVGHCRNEFDIVKATFVFETKSTDWSK